jgi:hypothetical protein
MRVGGMKVGLRGRRSISDGAANIRARYRLVDFGLRFAVDVCQASLEH